MHLAYKLQIHTLHCAGLSQSLGTNKPVRTGHDGDSVSAISLIRSVSDYEDTEHSDSL